MFLTQLASSQLRLTLMKTGPAFHLRFIYIIIFIYKIQNTMMFLTQLASSQLRLTLMKTGPAFHLRYIFIC